MLSRAEGIAMRVMCMVCTLLVLPDAPLLRCATGSECRSAEDCAPAKCCGATACLPSIVAEAGCDKVSCPVNCKPFSLDCGGFCTCSSIGKCAAVLGKNNDKQCTAKMRRRNECL
mmetsp:Transcript_45130/g.52203  ORF Transcript_45130/g.52203 Transcript_45130/m.52203 type:complete len:115 (+) Transcript_45130:57-401(+)